MAITPQTLNSIVKYELTIERIKSIPLPLQYINKLYNSQKADELSHLSNLIGIPIGYNKALDIQQGKESGLEIEKHILLNNYRSTQEFIKSYTDMQFMPVSQALFHHLNTLLFKNVVEDWELGKNRDFSTVPSPLYDNWTDLKDYYPNINLSTYVDEMTRSLYSKTNQTHKILIAITIFHEIMDKQPLLVANQISNIAFLSATLKNFGYNPNNLMPVAKIFDENEATIINQFKKKSIDDFSQLLSELLANEALALLNNIKFIYENNVKKKILLSAQFNDRQLKILEYLQIHKNISREEYAKLMGVSFMTAFRDLHKLLEDGYLTTKSRGRGTKYILKTDPNQDKNSPVPTMVFNDLE